MSGTAKVLGGTGGPCSLSHTRMTYNTHAPDDRRPRRGTDGAKPRQGLRHAGDEPEDTGDPRVVGVGVVPCRCLGWCRWRSRPRPSWGHGWGARAPALAAVACVSVCVLGVGSSRASRRHRRQEGELIGCPCFGPACWMALCWVAGGFGQCCAGPCVCLHLAWAPYLISPVQTRRTLSVTDAPQIPAIGHTLQPPTPP